jgi:hypothetical protein
MDSQGNRIIKVRNLIKNSKVKLVNDNIVSPSNQKDSSQFNPNIHRIGYSALFPNSLSFNRFMLVMSHSSKQVIQ